MLSPTKIQTHSYSLFGSLAYVCNIKSINWLILVYDLRLIIQPLVVGKVYPAITLSFVEVSVPVVNIMRYLKCTGCRSIHLPIYLTGFVSSLQSPINMTSRSN